MVSFKNFSQMADDIKIIAQNVCKEFFLQSPSTEVKSDASPVTIADQTIEKQIRELISSHYPDHGIHGEEFGITNHHSDYLWVIDPIDGTQSFICGKVNFCTIIALFHKGQPIYGMIYQPILDHLWLSGDKKTLFNNTPCLTNQNKKTLKDAILSTTAYELFNAAEWQQFLKVKQHVFFTHWGGDAYGFGLLSSGHIDLIIESNLKFYDYAPLIAVIENSGGIITDWDGKALTDQSSGQIIAAGSKHLHKEALTWLQS